MKFIALWLILLLSPWLVDAASATATATVTFSVGSITVLSVSGNPGPLNITTAVAGSQPTSVSDATTTYALTTNSTNQSITAVIDSNMPTGVTLSVALQAPAGATSAGSMALSTTLATLVTGIGNVAQSGLTITYTLAATIAAGVVPTGTRVVTYTLGP